MIFARSSAEIGFSSDTSVQGSVSVPLSSVKVAHGNNGNTKNIPSHI